MALAVLASRRDRRRRRGRLQRRHGHQLVEERRPLGERSGSPTATTGSGTAFPRHQRRWAHRTSECESGGNPRAIGGGGLYRGAFQFLKSTWRSSPKSPGGDPIAYSYRTQAVVAVLLKRRDGAGHWPVCG